MLESLCVCIYSRGGLIVCLAGPVTGPSVTLRGNWNDRLIQSPGNSITQNLTIKHTHTHTPGHAHLLSSFILGLSLHHCLLLISLSLVSFSSFSSTSHWLWVISVSFKRRPLYITYFSGFSCSLSVCLSQNSQMAIFFFSKYILKFLTRVCVAQIERPASVQESVKVLRFGKAEVTLTLKAKGRSGPFLHNPAPSCSYMPSKIGFSFERNRERKTNRLKGMRRGEKNKSPWSSHWSLV